MIKYRLIIIIISYIFLYYGMMSSGDKISLFTSCFAFYAILLLDHEKMKSDAIKEQNAYLIRIGKLGSRFCVVICGLCILGLSNVLVLMQQGDEYYIAFSEIMAPDWRVGFSMKIFFILSGFIIAFIVASEYFKPDEKRRDKVETESSDDSHMAVRTSEVKG